MKVFLSSTYIDLIEHRKAVVQALRTMGQDVDHMEIFGAMDAEPTKAALKQLEKCNVVVGIYAYRYGSIPKELEISITEQEYLHAKSNGIPIFCFVADDSFGFPRNLMDKDTANIDKFKAKIMNDNVVDFFTTPDNLATKIVATIGKYHAENNSTLESRKPTSSTLPNQPYFFGREKELATIADAISLESRTWGALIDGPGGIGKTALAIRAAYLAPKENFESKYFVTAKVRELTPSGEKPLAGFTHPNYLEMLNELAIQLGEDQIPRLAPEERTKELWNSLRGSRTIVIFDNLETLREDDRDRLFQFLSRLPEGNKAIVTSRRRADADARVIRLDRLSANEAIQLMEELAKNNPRLAREDNTALHSLYEITHGNPLLIKWVVGQLGRDGSACRTISDACGFLKRAPKGNDPLEYIFGDLIGTFTENETMILAALTHFNQPAKVRWITIAANLAEGSTETLLEDLTDRSILITNGEAGEFFLPPLASHFIRSKRLEYISKTGNQLTDYVYDLSIGSAWQHYDQFPQLEEVWPCISATIPYFINGDNSRLQHLCESLKDFLEFSGYWDEAILLNEQAENKALAEGDTSNAGYRAHDAGWIYFLTSQAPKVLECATRAEAYWEKNGGSHEMAMASRLRGKGYDLNKDYPSAIESYVKALEYWRSDDTRSIEVASCINDLAEAEFALGDYDIAELDFKDALRMAQDTHYVDGIAFITGNLANIPMKYNQWSDAEILIRTSLDMAQKIGKQELIALDNLRLAVAIYRLNRPSEAVSYAQRAVDIFSRLHSPYLQDANNVLAKCKTAFIKK